MNTRKRTADHLIDEATEGIMKQLLVQQNAKTRCLLCAHALDLPIKICPSGHYACARCYKEWSDREKFKVEYAKNGMPFLAIRKDGDTCIMCPKQCGVYSMQLAKQPADHLIYDLVDHGRERRCLFEGCQEAHAGSAMCQHLFRCQYQTIACAACSVIVRVSVYKQHIQTDCTGLLCRLCLVDTSGPVVPATYTSSTLAMHLQLHKNSAHVRELLFHYYSELGKVIGSPACGGELVLPVKGDPTDGADFIDAIALLASMKHAVDGRNGSVERLAHAIPVPANVLSGLLK